EILSDASTDAQSKVSALKTELEEEIAAKANASNVYTKTDIDGKLNTINQNLNTKLDGAAVDEKIATAKEEILGEASSAAESALEARVGDIPKESTIK